MKPYSRPGATFTNIGMSESWAETSDKELGCDSKGTRSGSNYRMKKKTSFSPDVCGSARNGNVSEAKVDHYFVFPAFATHHHLTLHLGLGKHHDLSCLLC